MAKQINLTNETKEQLLFGVKKASEKYLFGSKNTKKRGTKK